jgi:hypothetical protein
MIRSLNPHLNQTYCPNKIILRVRVRVRMQMENENGRMEEWENGRMGEWKNGKRMRIRMRKVTLSGGA